METMHAIEIPLPPDIEPTADERALVDVLCRTVFELRPAEGEPCWVRTARLLRTNGWDVHWRLTWVAEGRREGHIEEGAGATLNEAFGRLQELTLLDEVEGCP
jgi:hypothetical protein